MSEDLKEIIPASLGLHPWRKKTLIAVGIFLAAAILVVGGSWAYGFVYRDSIYPGVYLGKHHMGGLTKAQAEEFIENFNNRIAKEGWQFSLMRAVKFKTLFCQLCQLKIVRWR